jgi:hypothetical protein
MEVQCTADLEPLVEFGIVPTADGRQCAKRSFSCTMKMERRTNDSLIQLPTLIRILCNGSGCSRQLGTGHSEPSAQK